MNFSKKDTSIIKGIAIILMLHHHNFLSNDRFEGFNIDFSPFSQYSMVTLASAFKICVGMFVFLSGYGLALSVKKYNDDYTLRSDQYKNYLYNRLFKLMTGYWFIYIVSFVITAVMANRPMEVYFSRGLIPGIYRMLIDIFGLSYIFDTPMLNGTWWYMSLAILIIILVPFIAWLSKKLEPLTLVLLCIFIPRIMTFFVQLEDDSEVNIIRWLLAIVLGVICAQYDIFARAKAFMITKSKVLSKLIKFVILTLVLGLIIYSRIKLTKSIGSDFTYELTDNVIPAFVCYYCYEFITDIPLISNILMFIGKHSMNIFLFHTFIRSYLFREFTYSFHHFALITLVLLLVSLAVSVVLELIKKYSGYNKLVDYFSQKINNRIKTA